MNPLPIVRDLCKLPNHFLRYGEPFCYANLSADKVAQGRRCFVDNFRWVPTTFVVSLQERSLDVGREGSFNRNTAAGGSRQVGLLGSGGQAS